MGKLVVDKPNQVVPRDFTARTTIDRLWAEAGRVIRTEAPAVSRRRKRSASAGQRRSR